MITTKSVIYEVIIKSFCFNQMKNASQVHLILKGENKETRVPMQKTEQGFNNKSTINYKLH